MTNLYFIGAYDSDSDSDSNSNTNTNTNTFFSIFLQINNMIDLLKT